MDERAADTGVRGMFGAPASPTELLSFRPTDGGYVDALAPGLTSVTLYELESAPTRARLLHFNDQPVPRSIDAAAIRVARGLGDAGGASEPGWVSLTYSGSDRLVMPPHEGSPQRPSLHASDWVALPPVTDMAANGRALLLTRVFSEGVLRCSNGGQPDRALGRAVRFAWGPGNGAVAPWRLEAKPRNLTAVYGVQYASRVPGLTVIAIGDSIMSSQRSTGGQSGFVRRAAIAVSTPALPVSFVNAAVPARRSADFIADGTAQIAAFRPQIAVIQCWSGNDHGPRADEQAHAALDRALGLARDCRRGRMGVVLCTAAPVFADQPLPEQARAWSNDRVRQIAEAEGFGLLDLGRLWGDGGAPAGYRAAFDSGDHVHPNDAANAVAGEALAVVLRGMLPAPG